MPHRLSQSPLEVGQGRGGGDLIGCPADDSRILLRGACLARDTSLNQSNLRAARTSTSGEVADCACLDNSASDALTGQSVSERGWKNH